MRLCESVRSENENFSSSCFMLHGGDFNQMAITITPLLKVCTCIEVEAEVVVNTYKIYNNNNVDN